MDIAAQVFAHLEMAVIKVIEPSAFELAGPSFWWLERFFFQTSPSNATLTPLETSPFFDDFLEQSQSVWRSPEQHSLTSGPWIEVDDAGREWPFDAQAIHDHGQRLLLITHLGASYAERVEILQSSRERLLDNERLEAEVSRRTQQLKEREEEVANRLLAAGGYRDQETGAHVKRIGLYSAAMAKALGWPPLRIDDLRVAAPMHDLGKIGIPDRVLLKPGRLDEDEFEIMKTHAELGARILSDTGIPMIEMARHIAWSHHEKWNGMGYPRQLQQDEIPIEARIVSVVDVYDAMIHKRVYKQPIAESETLHFIRTSANTHFDPRIVEAFLDIYDTIKAIKDRVQEHENDQPSPF
ncbi:HD-GYP domain-containing protein [Rhabdochromatium marinum]|uniref:HD-GYP domain-containing protein n=1 Tax=Rhabdochromatium marinum TaxID=48729 RepID=UPI001906354A|nr:HD domain-containing phosphohydrolase [Rhabdochromatium marinum]